MFFKNLFFGIFIWDLGVLQVKSIFWWQFSDKMNHYECTSLNSYFSFFENHIFTRYNLNILLKNIQWDIHFSHWPRIKTRPDKAAINRHFDLWYLEFDIKVFLDAIAYIQFSMSVTITLLTWCPVTVTFNFA